VAANRIQRLALFLENYDYSDYVKSENNESADALSWLTIAHTNDTEYLCTYQQLIL